MTPILVNGPFVALGEAVHFPPWERFSDFPFPSFRKKETFDALKSLPPPRCEGYIYISGAIFVSDDLLLKLNEADLFRRDNYIYNP